MWSWLLRTADWLIHNITPQFNNWLYFYKIEEEKMLLTYDMYSEKTFVIWID